MLKALGSVSPFIPRARAAGLRFRFCCSANSRLDFNQLVIGTARRPVYKTRERIHRGKADPRLLAIPASWGRVADPNPNWGAV